jgi:hypothetical protein
MAQSGYTLSHFGLPRLPSLRAMTRKSSLDFVQPMVGYNGRGLGLCITVQFLPCGTLHEMAAKEFHILAEKLERNALELKAVICDGMVKSQR